MKLLSGVCECADVCEEQSYAQSLRLLQGRCGHWPWVLRSSEWPGRPQLSCVYISPVSVRQPRRQHHHHIITVTLVTSASDKCCTVH